MLGHVTSVMLFLSHYPPLRNDQIIFLHICARSLLLLSFPVHLPRIFIVILPCVMANQLLVRQGHAARCQSLGSGHVIIQPK